MRFKGCHLTSTERHADRHKQRLTGDTHAIHLLLHLLVGDPLMRGMHVDHNKSGGILCKHINTKQLTDRITQGRNAVVLCPGNTRLSQPRWRLIIDLSNLTVCFESGILVRFCELEKLQRRGNVRRTWTRARPGQ